MYTEIVLKNNLSEHFTLISYPDGQHSLKLNLNKLNVKTPIKIKCRIKLFSELEVFLCLVRALEKYDFIISEIHFEYIFGMRSDRAFEIGEPNYFRDVVKPILDSLDYDMFFLAPHNIYQTRNNQIYPIPFEKNSTLIGGDYSVKRWSPRLCGYFEKQRKERINVNLIIEDREMLELSTCITVIDDLCDGGATFIAEGEYLKRKFPDKKLKLFVYHGLFTQGVHPLLAYYDEIICTNSYQDIDHPKVTQIKVI